MIVLSRLSQEFHQRIPPTRRLNTIHSRIREQGHTSGLSRQQWGYPRRHSKCSTVRATDNLKARTEHASTGSTTGNVIPRLPSSAKPSAGQISTTRSCSEHCLQSQQYRTGEDPSPSTEQRTLDYCHSSMPSPWPHSATSSTGHSPNSRSND